MKLFKLAIGLLGLSLAACSSEDPQVPQAPGGEVAGGDSRYMSVTIRNANGGRANPGQQAGNLFEEGLTGENEIKSVRFYFFDEAGQPVAVKHDRTNYYDCTELESAEGQMPNVEKKLTAVIVINTQEGDNLNNLKKMVAVANIPAKDLELNGKTTLSLSELQGLIHSYIVNENKPYATADVNVEKPADSKLAPLPMTSSVYGDGPYDIAAEILPTNIKQNADDAKKSPVDIYIERIHAKVRVAFAWQNMVTEDVTYNNNTVKAVKLNSRNASGETTAITTDGTSSGDPIYAIFTNWCPTGVAKTSYLFKKFSSSWDLGWTAAKPSDFRSFWAENPFVDPTGAATSANCTLQYFKPSEAKGTYGTRPALTDNLGNYGNYNGNFYYIQENAATKDKSGVKTEFTEEDADSKLSNRTQVFLGAVLVTIKDGIATPVELSEWGGRKYVGTTVINAMLNAVKNQIWIAKKTDATAENPNITWDSKTLDVSDVELVSATDIFGDEYFDAQNDLRYLTYIQLKKTFTLPTGYSFYKSQPIEGADDPEKYADNKAVNEALRSIPGAKVWKSGMTYYYTDIQHESTASATTGYYGVVRNHIYDIELEKVYGLGTPIYDPEEDTIIIPQKPQDLDSFIGARINVLSWRVIRQGVTLDW